MINAVFEARRSVQGVVALACAIAISVSVALARPSEANADQWSAFEDMPATAYCSEAAVVDESGTVLFSLNGSRSMAMASTTKMMTAIVALESGTPLDTVYTVTDVVDTVYGQLIGYRPGDTATLNEMLRGLLVYSGNDAAVCIAECVGGSVDNFVSMMNQKASELGLTGTHYINPHGLDEEGHYSTPLDLVTIGRYGMQNGIFRSIVSSHHAVLNVGGEQVYFESTDALSNVYPGMRGIKTGYTYDAGNAFVGACTRGGKTIFISLIGCETSDMRWYDAQILLDWAFSHYPSNPIDLDGSFEQYSIFADSFAWSVASSTHGQVGSREESRLTAEFTGTRSSVSDGTSSTGSIVWKDESGSIEAARPVSSDGLRLSTHAFGPLVSELFY